MFHPEDRKQRGDKGNNQGVFFYVEESKRADWDLSLKPQSRNRIRMRTEEEEGRRMRVMSRRRSSECESLQLSCHSFDVWQQNIEEERGKMHDERNIGQTTPY